MGFSQESNLPISQMYVREGCQADAHGIPTPICTRGEHSRGACYSLLMDSWFGVVRNREALGPEYKLLIFPRRDENGVRCSQEKVSKKRKKAKV